MHMMIVITFQGPHTNRPPSALLSVASLRRFRIVRSLRASGRRVLTDGAYVNCVTGVCASDTTKHNESVTIECLKTNNDEVYGRGRKNKAYKTSEHAVGH
ncbi:uncharacterized [Tachysurus ichikawai]